MHLKIKDAFSKIKEELNDHRECLNHNTNEIQGNYEYICRLDAKIEKLAERLDELTMMVQQNSVQCDKFSVSTLTRKEQEVFMAIYVTEGGMNYSDIAKKTCLTENLVVCYVTNLIAKGVPLVKKYLANEVRLHLDEEFRSQQAQHNILHIGEAVSKSLARA